MFSGISLGFILGALTWGLIGALFFFSRPQRRVGNRIVIYIGYLVIGGSSVGSVILLGQISEHLGITKASAGDAALWAYAVSVVFGVFLIIRIELKWRKSVGLPVVQKRRFKK